MSLQSARPTPPSTARSPFDDLDDLVRRSMSTWTPSATPAAVSGEAATAARYGELARLDDRPLTRARPGRMFGHPSFRFFFADSSKTDLKMTEAVSS